MDFLAGLVLPTKEFDDLMDKVNHAHDQRRKKRKKGASQDGISDLPYICDEGVQRLSMAVDMYKETQSHIRQAWRRLQNEIRNWTGTFEEYEELKMDYKSGPRFWRERVPVFEKYR